MIKPTRPVAPTEITPATGVALPAVATATVSTPEKRAAFLEALAHSGSVTQAADAAGIHRSTPYVWRKSDPDFAAAWATAFATGIEALEAELIRRAFTGSDTAAIFILKGNMPHKYKDRVASEISGPNGAPIEVDAVSEQTLTLRLAALFQMAETRRANGEDLA